MDQSHSSTSVATVSWKDFCMQQLREDLQCIEATVQCLPEGPIRVSDLLWELRETKLVRKVHENRRKDTVVAQQCFIPTNRLKDFKKGMEEDSSGVSCKYITLRTKPAKEGMPSKPTPLTGKEVTRYHCHYGPEDHSGNTRTITSSLLPNPRRKLLLTASGKKRHSRRKAQEGEEPAEGDMIPEAIKKKRGKHKSPSSSTAGLQTEKPKRRRKKTSKTTVHPIRNDDNVSESLQRLTLCTSGNFTKEPVPMKGSRMRRKKGRELAVDVVLAAPSTALQSYHCIDLNITSEDELLPDVVGQPTVDSGRGMDLQKEKGVKKKKTVPCKRVARRKSADKTRKPIIFGLDLNKTPTTLQCIELLLEDNVLGFKVDSFCDIGSTVGSNEIALARESSGAIQTSPGSKADPFKKGHEVAEELPDSTGSPRSQKWNASANPTQVEDNSSGQISADIEGALPGKDAFASKSKTKKSQSSGSNCRPKKTHNSAKQSGGSLKRGCLASFSVKTLLFLPHVIQICIYEAYHVNHNRVQCHGIPISGDRSAFAWQLSPAIKEFVTTLLRSGFSVSQVMAKHMAVVKEAIQKNQQLTRDMFLHERDVRNLATKVARETYMLPSEDAKSVQLWVQENADKVFFYQETGTAVQGAITPSTVPFTLGIQTPWQRQTMVKFGHEGAVSIDATFGTNEKKFPLYTVMVFDEWHNGIPVAFIITSRTAQDDLTPWMTALETSMQKMNPLWKPNAFIVDCAQGEINSLSIVWPHTAIFLCLWHVHRAWQKQSCIKIRDANVRAEVFRGLGAIMYDRSCPPGVDATARAILKLRELQQLHPDENEFWEYVAQQWLPKVHMWVVGFRNLPYAGQDTNAAIENYHGYMKSILKSERSRLTGRRVDWCIHVLTEDVHTHYWYKQIYKVYGFLDNRKVENVVVASLLQARDIPDSDVTLPTVDGGPAYVTSQSHRHLRYEVFNPTEVWASCNCVHSQRGNTCKHKVKVLRMIHPELAEGTVARYCGALKGRNTGGIANALNPVDVRIPSLVTVPPDVVLEAPLEPHSEVGEDGERRLPERGDDPHLTLQRQARDLLVLVDGNPTLMDHLEADFNRLLGKLKLLAAEIEAGNIHPERPNPVFHVVQDGLGMRLSRLRDMLERRSAQ